MTSGVATLDIQAAVATILTEIAACGSIANDLERRLQSLTGDYSPSAWAKRRTTGMDRAKTSRSSLGNLRFTHLAMNNWRNFRHVDVDLQKRVFLVGPNASGKSNFLDVFRFLRDIASVGGGFRQAVGRRHGVSSIRTLSARKYPDVTVCVSLGDEHELKSWTYTLSFRQDKLRRPVIAAEKVLYEGKELLARPNEEDKKDPERLTQTYLEQVNVNQTFRKLADFLASVRYLHIVPQLVREPDRSVGRKNDPFGGDFLEQIARVPERTQKSRLTRICSALGSAVPQLKKIELARDMNGTPHLRGKYEHWRPHGAWQSEEQFSDGTLRLLGLLWAVLEGGGPLLLEEPELSLHPEVVRTLPQVLARVNRRTGRQIVLSTHSSELLDDAGIGLDETLLLFPTSEGTEVSTAGSHADVKALLEGGLRLSEAVMPKTRPQHVEQLSIFGDA